MIVYEEQSEVQRITLEHDDKRGLSLFLDGMPQFHQATEYRYHESIAVAPALFGMPRTVFVGGGGDGLAVARLLRLGTVEEVVLCDYDPAITRLAQEHDYLSTINERSLLDPRVTVVNEDAVAWLEDHDRTFDLIICDFPDPYFPELGKLYTRELFELVRRRLSPEGVMVTQTLTLPEVTRIIRASVRAAFPHEGYFRAGAGAGFTVAANRPLVRRAPVPTWTRYISEELADGLFILPKDARKSTEPGRTEPATGDGASLIKAALAGGIAPQYCERYPYRPDTTDLYLTAEAAEKLTGGQIRMMLEALAERTKLVVALNEDLVSAYGPQLEALGLRASDKRYEHFRAVLNERVREELQRAWARLDDGSVAHLAAKTCRPSDDPIVGPMLRRYVERWGERYFETPGSYQDWSEMGFYVVTSDAEETPVGLFKVLEQRGAGLHAVELEIIYGEGSPRQSLLSLVLALSYLQKIGVQELVAYAPEGVFGRSLTRLGAERLERLVPYAR